MGSYYNYQIGIFFAILIGGLLLLFIFIAAIYFGCVLTMRPEKKRRYSSPNSVRAAPPRQWQGAEQTTAPYTNLYTARGTPTEYVPAQSPLVQSPAAGMAAQPQPPVSPPRELGVDQGYRPATQTEYYQQRVVTEPAHTGPAGWQTMPAATPVAAVTPGYMTSPVQAQAPAYHTSSV